MLLYTYPWYVFQLQARVSVRWNNNEIDDIYGAEVTLYTCEVNGNSCSRCLSPEASPARFQCLWCGQECAFRDKAVCTQDALDQSQTDQCGSPVITSFWPTSGPMEGNTRVEVSGTDLGASFSDVVSVMIGDSNCSLAGMESYYQPGLSVSCLTAPGARDGTGRVTVTVAGQGASRQATSSQAYTYTDPTIQSFTPRMGPMAGGTEVTITGSHVGSGRLHSAHFGDVECNIRFVNETTVLCETGRSGAVRNETLRFTIDDSAVRLSEEKFSFLANPQILNLNDPSFDRRSITSGGINMVVIGEGFDLIQDPMTVITYGGARSQEVCSGNSSVLVCPSPSLPGPVSQRRRRDIDSPVQAKLDFDFDGFVIDGGLLTYYRDPVYFNFSETDMILNVNPVVPLTLQGIALNLASEKHDIQVLIGSDGSCPVILLNATHLRCNLPVVKPGPGDYTGALSPGPRRSLPSVVVLNGNLEFQLGSLHYDDDSFPAYIIALVVILIVILVAMVIAMALMYRRSQSNVSKIARQLNAMELKIRHKADAVFQALHVDMSEIRAQVLQHKMPFVSTRDYLLNMMFAGLEHLPPTADPEYVSESMERAMLEFSHLLGQKDFLVRFIDRLEERNLHNKRARVNFASLITVILVTEGKMAYLTEVLMSYIKRDVERAAEKGHMVSLFKRTETIVEKLLSNWIALCMYDFLKHHAAQPLYILYQAIQMQSEKGPVDAITGQAHFSLNFDFIMEQDIQFQEVALAIVGEDNRVTSYVTVLDVDCITQAKQKILDAEYRRQHFVNQCRAHDLDLDLDFSPADTRNRDYSQADLASASQSLWHLVKDDVTTAPAYDERGSTFQLQQQLDKNMCAPQLLIMKSTISRFLDDFLDAVFRKPSDTPVTIKYLFDFFDSLAGEHCGDDEKVVASRWKSNSLSQRFWVTALSHPSYIFTMRQCRPADQCITVITNMLDDACKNVIPEKNQDPSLSRLVYLKDLPGYIKLIEAFYDDIATQPGVSLGQSLHEEFGKIQQEFSGLCSRSATLKELYDFAKPDMQDLLEPVTSLLVEERLYEL
ncbi:plexin-B1-like [Diadema setosum]|uniref:plexin-B1-like n=1 Tax=Diadema setosum TaxID=31175 RepID=UPI003B3ABC88